MDQEFIKVILDASKLEVPAIPQSVTGAVKKNKTMMNKDEEVKGFFQDQAGTTGFNHSDEKSMHLKISDSNISNGNNQEDDESDEDAEVSVSFNNDSNQSSNIGSLREMSVKTKENKDAYQEFSARKKKSLKPIVDEYRKNGRSRHNLLDYSNHENIASKDSICVEGTATNIRSIKTMNFISTTENRRFNTQVSSKLAKFLATNLFL